MTEPMFLEPPGLVVPESALTCAKARQFAEYLRERADPYSRLIECRAQTAQEAVVFETDVSVPQGGSKYGIQERERIATIFFEGDRRIPDVLTLRESFPPLPHQNLREEETPRSICFTDERYEDLRRHWTPWLFLHLIRSWLERAALGYLHADDQPLEPFFLSAPFHFLVPREVFSDQLQAPLHLRLVDDGTDSGQKAVIATPAGDMGHPLEEDEQKRTLAIAIQTDPVEHGIIRRQPASLEDLVDALDEAGFDLLRGLRLRLRAWHQEEKLAESISSRLAIILWIPKTRRPADSDPEAMDTLAVVTSRSVLEVGRDVGAWEIQKIDGIPRPAHLVGVAEGPDNENRGADTPISLFPVSFQFNRRMAAAASGGGNPREDKILIVGVGALGSHIVNNLSRAGHGRLTLVDHDMLLPHNLARHVLGGSNVGRGKASALAKELSALFVSEPEITSLSVNILSRDPDIRRAIEDALRSVEVVLDLSASVAVSRFLSYADSSGRRISSYLNPTGTDLVLLAEDTTRRVTLHDLELQLYRSLVEHPELEKHYEPVLAAVRNRAILAVRKRGLLGRALSGAGS